MGASQLDLRELAAFAEIGEPGDERSEAADDPLPQLPRGLPGKGEAEHGVGLGEAVRDEPHDPVRHRFGFAATRACDDQGAPGQWVLDHGALLVGWQQRRLPGGGKNLRDAGRREYGLAHAWLTA